MLQLQHMINDLKAAHNPLPTSYCLRFPQLFNVEPLPSIHVTFFFTSWVSVLLYASMHFLELLPDLWCPFPSWHHSHVFLSNFSSFFYFSSTVLFHLCLLSSSIWLVTLHCISLFVCVSVSSLSLFCSCLCTLAPRWVVWLKPPVGPKAGSPRWLVTLKSTIIKDCEILWCNICCRVKRKTEILVQEIFSI